MKSGSLHRLLESTYIAHKNDIHDVACGHLNHNNLQKLEPIANTASGTRWKTSKLSKHAPENPFASRVISRKKADAMLAENIGLMEHALLDFSVGTTGALPEKTLIVGNNLLRPKSNLDKRKKSRVTSSSVSKDSFHILPTKSEIELENLVLNEIEKLRVVYKSRKGSDFHEDNSLTTLGKETTATSIRPQILKTKRIVPYTSITDNVFSEELKLPELMLPSSDENVRLPPSVRNKTYNTTTPATKNKFITTHHAAITKKDQFKKLINFETNILHKYETHEQNVRDGHKAVDHLEQKLIQSLMGLENNKVSVLNPNFERLQAYSEVWTDMCLDSTCLGKTLSAIKCEYDEFLSYLLDDVKKSKHAEILRCIRSLAGLGARESDAGKLLSAVTELETTVEKVLLENANLQKRIAVQTERIIQQKIQRKLEEEENRRRMLPIRQPIRKIKKEILDIVKSEVENRTVEGKLRSLRKELWKSLDELKILQSDLKHSYVPKIIHKNYVHAVKDTELEIQEIKLQKQQEEPPLSKLDDNFQNEMNKLNINESEREEVERYLADL